MTLSEHDRGWLEAAIDGEGCLSLLNATCKGKHPPLRRGYTWFPECRLSNTDLNFLKYAQTIAGGHMRGPMTARHGHEKPWYELSLRRPEMLEVLPQLHLVIKESRRLLVIEALELLKGRLGNGRLSDYEDSQLWDIYQRIRGLNLKGRKTEKLRPQTPQTQLLPQRPQQLVSGLPESLMQVTNAGRLEAT